jgi:hypothetical protein
MKRIRSKQRGAIMVEAVAVISFCTICFIALAYFRSMYVQKIQVQRLSRSSALTHAMGACRTDPRSGVNRDLGKRRFNEKSASGIPFGAIPSVGGDKGNAGLQKIREKNGDTGLDKVTTITITGDASGITKPRPDGPEHGFRSEVSSTSFMVCGDPTPDDRYEGMVDQIASLF